MLLDVCFGSKSVWRVLILYAESPGAGFTRQELRRHTRLGNKALSFALKRLTAFDILSAKKDVLPLKVYKLNVGNEYCKGMLDLLGKEKRDLNHLRYDFALIAREFSRKAIDAADVLGVYLFGSIAKRTYREDSDVDFAVVLGHKDPKEDMEISLVAEGISKKFKRKIQCFIITPEQINNSRKRTKLTEEILKHGIKIV